MTVNRTFDIVFDSQKIFRLLLDCMARPGKITRLPDISPELPCSTSAYPALVLLTLLDHEVTFAIIDASARTAEISDFVYQISRLSGSKPVPASEADFVVIRGGCSGSAILQVKRGTLAYPDIAATVIYEVGVISSRGEAGLTFELSGPGIEDKTELNIAGLDESEVRQLIQTRQEFPLGPDVILVDKQGAITGLPRSTRINLRS